MGGCLTQELVERYLAGNSSGDERREVETHLAECETCRNKVESTRVNRALQGQSTAVNAQDSSTEDTSKENQANQDESPTRSMPGISSVLPGGHIPNKSADSMFENYQIVEELPRGGQAVVYKAIHTATKTNVAIKILLPSLLASTRARYYFEREAELIASLDHPNIVRIRDSGIIHGQYYFVMEYIEGESLNRYVHSQNLSFRERVELFNKICTAITYAHQQGIIHRDLKFANILIDKRCEPHILDFGLAKAIGLSEQAGNRAVATITGQWAGSLSNMSPEQAAGQPHLIDVRTDVYSLGVILYHMLTGEYPYDVTGSTLEVLQNIQKSEPIRPRQIIRKFDSDIEAILLSALAKDRAQRYQSAADLQSDIENWLQGRPIRVRSISTLYLLRKIIARHRYASAVVGLLLLIVLSFLYVSFDLYISTKKAQQEAQAVAEQSAAKTARNVALEKQILEQQMTFSYFLQKWDAGQFGLIPYFKGYFGKETREAIAIDFWLDPRLLTEKVNEFRQKLGKSEPCFVEFVIAEYYLRKGNRAEAIKAYRKCLLHDAHLEKDQRLVVQAKSRLYELSDENWQDRTLPTVKN